MESTLVTAYTLFPNHTCKDQRLIGIATSSCYLPSWAVSNRPGAHDSAIDRRMCASGCCQHSCVRTYPGTPQLCDMLLRAASPAKLFGAPFTVLTSLQQQRVLQTTLLPSLRLWFDGREQHLVSCRAYSTDVSRAPGIQTWSKVDT